MQYTYYIHRYIHTDRQTYMHEHILLYSSKPAVLHHYKALHTRWSLLCYFRFQLGATVRHCTSTDLVNFMGIYIYIWWVSTEMKPKNDFVYIWNIPLERMRTGATLKFSEATIYGTWWFIPQLVVVGEFTPVM